MSNDLTGQKFGELTAIRESPERLRKAIAWECRCSCGIVALVERHRLLNGIVKSCGCLRKRSPANTIDLTGQTFGKLTVVDRAGTTPRGNALWLCRCTCGNTTSAMGTSLRRGDTVSCGCDGPEQIANARKVLTDEMSVDGVQLPLLTKGVRADSQSGHKGIHKRTRKGRTVYEASITIKGRRIYLGSYSKLDDAIAARKRGEEQYHKPYLKGDKHNEK